MRAIHDHKADPANDSIEIAAVDESGMGDANHVYCVTFKNGLQGNFGRVILEFQNGAVNEVGVNGFTHEALLAIIADRLQGFQEGRNKCRENALALNKIQEAMHWLHSRTRARMARGTHTV